MRVTVLRPAWASLLRPMRVTVLRPAWASLLRPVRVTRSPPTSRVGRTNAARRGRPTTRWGRSVEHPQGGVGV
ncbi:hypothetical protein [Micromonospora sp. RL09-050-HVF-A]|uniref:hypothetical protein n=1 Tax=Micromonospora sp. RL09-050-HVF-A TaxID=1703433 RepID=UPI001C5DED78|nr:hypothetical protein [Micromonospora sp. RL09-050-HVF-A]MBW4706059.1 hypothetical protein [Micromonospora sp. RL09-050-HVF-A]